MRIRGYFYEKNRKTLSLIPFRNSMFTYKKSFYYRLFFRIIKPLYLSLP